MSPKTSKLITNYNICLVLSRTAPDKNLFTSAGLHVTWHPVKPGIKRTLRWANAPRLGKGFSHPRCASSKQLHKCLFDHNLTLGDLN